MNTVQKWEVQSFSIADGWSNVWMVEDHDGEMVPDYFDTENEAHQAILEEINEQKRQYDSDLEVGNELVLPDSLENYRLVAVSVETGASIQNA